MGRESAMYLQIPLCVGTAFLNKWFNLKLVLETGLQDCRMQNKENTALKRYAPEQCF